MLDFEKELSDQTFRNTEAFLLENLGTYDETHPDMPKGRIYSFLAHLYHHRMRSDAKKVSEYVRKGVRLHPKVEYDLWLLQMSEGALARDWNCRNHHETISFFKELVKKYPEISKHYLDLKEHKVSDAESWLAKLEEKFSDDANVMFQLACFHADACRYDQAIEYFEKSFALEAGKPRYNDALQAQAMIYEIQGKYEEAINALNRMIKNFDESFGIREGAPIDEVEREKQRIFSQIVTETP